MTNDKNATVVQPRDSSEPAEGSEVDAKPSEGVLYVGIDLGTSRTAVASSNGVRECVASFVGYPKDVVSRKALKVEKLFGSDALSKRLMLDLYRPLERGVIKFSDGDDPDSPEAKSNARAAADLVRHAVSLAKPRADELVYAVIGCPAEGSIKNKKAILEAAKNVVDSAMICSEPFAVAYGLDLFYDTLVIDIGAGTTDLCRMHGTMPAAEDQITLSEAGDFIDRRLFESLKQTCPGAQFTIHKVQEIKERYAFVGESRDPIHIELPVEGKPTRFEVADAIREACRSIIPPIVDALGKLVASFDPDFQSKLKNNVLLGGGGSQIVGLGDAIEKEMHERLGEGSVRTVQEPIYAGANGALKTAHDMPKEYWEQLK
jgi:rod shape-determining protein MreB